MRGGAALAPAWGDTPPVPLQSATVPRSTRRNPVHPFRAAAACLFAVYFTATQISAAPEPKRHTVDVCVYGGTSAGVIAAVAAKKEGKSVLLIEPGRHLGGMSSGGLGWTDFGNKAVIGGLSLDFYRRVGKVHRKTGPSWTFEPSAAERVFNEFVYQSGFPVFFEHRVTTV